MSRPPGRARGALVLTTAGLATGVCAVAGGAAAVLSGLTATGLVTGQLLRGAPNPRSAGLWRVGNGLALVTASVLALSGAPLLVVGVALVGWLMVHRAWTGTGAADDRVALLLSMLLVLLGCILSVSPWLALLFAAWAAAAPGALLLCHRDAEAEAANIRPVAPRAVTLPAMGLATVGLTAFFYLILPRLPSAGALAGLRKPESVAGFSNDVALGDMTPILGNPGVVLRVQLGGPVPSTGLYFRGAVLDAFDGVRWARTLTATDRVRSSRPPSNALPQRIQQEPLDSNVLFGLGEVVSAVGPFGSAQRDAGDGMHSAMAAEGLTYTVWSVPPTDDEATLAQSHPDVVGSADTGPSRQAARLRIWTQLPDGLDPRIPALAKKIVADAGAPTDAWSQARAVESYLRTQFVYSDQVEPDVAGQSLSRFLFETRRGHCEYFGTALAILLRTLGLPTRLVTGFLGGEWNGVGNYLVLRQEDAHAWVELNLGAVGWVTLDGTPAAEAALRSSSWLSQAADLAKARWYQLILDYDLKTQLSFLQSIGVHAPRDEDASGEGVSGAMIGGLLGALGGMIGARLLLSWLAGDRKATARSQSRIAALHETARRRVARRGWAIPPALPPVAAARWLRAQAGETAAPLETLAWLLYQSRYGGEPEESILPQARDAIVALRALRPPDARTDRSTSSS